MDEFVENKFCLTEIVSDTCMIENFYNYQTLLAFRYKNLPQYWHKKPLCLEKLKIKLK